jgi:hypothetical protein
MVSGLAGLKMVPAGEVLPILLGTRETARETEPAIDRQAHGDQCDRIAPEQPVASGRLWDEFWSAWMKIAVKRC